LVAEEQHIDVDAGKIRDVLVELQHCFPPLSLWKRVG
jgi:hypothetical protein